MILDSMDAWIRSQRLYFQKNTEAVAAALYTIIDAWMKVGNDIANMNMYQCVAIPCHFVV